MEKRKIIISSLLFFLVLIVVSVALTVKILNKKVVYHNVEIKDVVHIAEGNKSILKITCETETFKVEKLKQVYLDYSEYQKIEETNFNRIDRVKYRLYIYPNNKKKSVLYIYYEGTGGLKYEELYYRN